MNVKVYNAATDKTKEFQGTPEQLVAQLDTAYPFLKRYAPKGLGEMLKRLANHQFYFLDVEQ